MGKKKKTRKKKKINLITIAFYAVALYMIVTIVGQRQDLSAVEMEKESKIAEKNEMSESLSLLQSDLEKINDPEQFLQMVERIARDEYRMVRPYETVYIDKNRSNNIFITNFSD